MNIAQTLQIIPQYAVLTEFINAANRRDRLAFRAHCERLFGERWRAQWGIGVVVQPEIITRVPQPW